MREQDDDRNTKKYRVEMVLKNLGMPDPDKEEELLSRIVMSPGVYLGAPTIRDSMVPVELVLRLLGGGHSETEIRDLLDLSEEDLRAVFVYAGRLVVGLEDCLCPPRKVPGFAGGSFEGRGSLRP